MSIDALQKQQTNFRGNFILPKLPTKAVKSKKLLKTIVEENKTILKPMPFDVLVSCKNASKKTINPKFQLHIEKEGYNTLNVFYGNTKVDGRDKNPAEKVKNFIQTFNEQYNRHKDIKPMTIAEKFRYAIERGIYNISSMFKTTS